MAAKEFATHYFNEKNKRQPFPCSTRFGWTYQPRLWTKNPKEVDCVKCRAILRKWGKI